MTTQRPFDGFFPPVSSLPCPGCGVVGMQATHAAEQTRFVCLACGSCWRLAMGCASKVDPTGCPGCRYRSVCLEKARAAGLGSDKPSARVEVPATAT